jgi:hypothetical protein
MLPLEPRCDRCGFQHVLQLVLMEDFGLTFERLRPCMPSCFGELEW